MVIAKGCACLYLSPWAFPPYFLLLLCSGGGVEDWVEVWEAAKVSPPERKLPASIVRPLSSCQECDRALQSWFMLLIWTTEPWGCWKGDSVGGATGAGVSVLVHWSDTAREEFAYEAQSKAGRDASPVQSSPSWNTSPSPKPSHILLSDSRYVFTNENLRQMIPTACDGWVIWLPISITWTMVYSLRNI